jgi:hypothetical protein
LKLLNAALVWGPNSGINYPFNVGSPQYPTRATDPVEFAALDTNGDGVIDWKDDPYGPYYPGDEYVDWVGLSLYWYPDEGTGFNGKVPPTFFQDQMTGQGATVQLFNPIVLNDGGLRNFYKRFSADKNKPMLIPETGAPWFDNILNPQATEVEVKQDWWRQIYSTQALQNLPNIHMVVHFEEKKADAGAQVRDWRILENPSVRNAFISDMNSIRQRILFGPDLSYQCDGSVSFKK